MDKSFFEENDTIMVSFRSKNSLRNSLKTKKEVRKFKRKGFSLSDTSILVLNKNCYASTLIFKKNK